MAILPSLAVDILNRIDALGEVREGLFALQFLGLKFEHEETLVGREEFVQLTRVDDPPVLQVAGFVRIDEVLVCLPVEIVK